ncbi:MAG: hypothetical protein ACJ72L_03970 [Marmoricola sp.]
MTEIPDHASHERRDLGDTDGPMEDALEESFTAQVLEGRAQFLLLAVLGNMAGGLGLVTVLRLVRSKDRLVEERTSNRDRPS